MAQNKLKCDSVNKMMSLCRLSEEECVCRISVFPDTPYFFCHQFWLLIPLRSLCRCRVYILRLSARVSVWEHHRLYWSKSLSGAQFSKINSDSCLRCQTLVWGSWKVRRLVGFYDPGKPGNTGLQPKIKSKCVAVFHLFNDVCIAVFCCCPPTPLSSSQGAALSRSGGKMQPTNGELKLDDVPVCSYLNTVANTANTLLWKVLSWHCLELSKTCNWIIFSPPHGSQGGSRTNVLLINQK